MSETTSPNDPRKISIATGVSYLITHVTSVAAAVLITSDAATAAIRTGILLELTLAITILVSGLGVQLLLRSHAPMLAGTFAGLRALEAAVIAVGTLPLLAMEEALPAQAAFAIHTAAFM